MNKGKIFNIIKIIFYIIIILGIVVYGLDLYTTRGEWRAALNEPPTISIASTSEIEVQANLTIYNPSHSRVQAKLVWYNIYLDNVYVGDGLIPYLTLNPGNNTVVLKTRINILNLPCATIKALSQDKPINITIKGYLIASIQLYGKIGYKDVTVPFNTTVYTVEPPRIPQATQELLKLSYTICTSPNKILEIINYINQTTGGGELPFPTP